MHPLMTKRKAISHLSPHLPLLLDSLYPAFKACPHTHPTLPIATAKGQPRPGHPEPPWLPAAPAHPPSATLATCCSCPPTQCHPGYLLLQPAWRAWWRLLQRVWL